MDNAFSEGNWLRWPTCLKSGGLRSESRTKDHAVKDIYVEHDGPNEHMLEVREVLDESKNSMCWNNKSASWEDEDRVRMSPSLGHYA